MIKLHDVEQGTDAWQATRQGLYTGSNAHKLLKAAGSVKFVNGVASSYSVAEITGFKGNFYTKRGHLLEDEAIELYERITGRKVSRPGFVTNTDFPGCGYSPDGWEDVAIVEVKAFEESKHMKLINGDIPLEVLAQVHYGMLICGKKLARLIPYNPDLEASRALKIIPIAYNQNIANNFKRILGGDHALNT